MSVFFVALTAVAILLLTAVPGYIFMKKKMLSEACMPGLSKILIFVCQPCLAVYTFKSAEFSLEKLANIGIFALLVIAMHTLMLGGAYLFLRKKYDGVIYRILTISTTFGNCAFFGIPVLEALMPEGASELIIYTTVYSVVMNVIAWTVGSAIISRDSSYVSLKKIFINPAMLGTVLALILFVFEIPIQKDLINMITVAAKMSTPISMIILGMRLATMDLKKIFSNYRMYLTVLAKQFLMPLIAFILVYFLPLSEEIRFTLFIICACPVASIVLNFSEIIGEGQSEAANMVILSTILSIVTLPLMALFLPLL